MFLAVAQNGDCPRGCACTEVKLISLSTTFGFGTLSAILLYRNRKQRIRTLVRPCSDAMQTAFEGQP